MEATESPGAHERHHHDAGAENEHVLVLAQIEAPDAADEQVADDEVEEPPRVTLVVTKCAMLRSCSR